MTRTGVMPHSWYTLLNYLRNETLFPLWATFSEHLKFMGEAKEWLFLAPSLKASDMAFNQTVGFQF